MKAWRLRLSGSRRDSVDVVIWYGEMLSTLLSTTTICPQPSTAGQQQTRHSVVSRVRDNPSSHTPARRAFYDEDSWIYTTHARLSLAYHWLRRIAIFRSRALKKLVNNWCARAVPTFRLLRETSDVLGLFVARVYRAAQLDWQAKITPNRQYLAAGMAGNASANSLARFCLKSDPMRCRRIKSNFSGQWPENEDGDLKSVSARSAVDVRTDVAPRLGFVCNTLRCAVFQSFLVPELWFWTA